MHRRRKCLIRALVLVALLFPVAPLHAQQRTTPKESPTTTAAKKRAGMPARFVSSGWQVRCATVGKQGKVACVLNQAVVEVRSRRSLVALSIPGNRKAMTLRLPHGLDLRVPVALFVDDRELGKATYVTSRPNGVYASFALGKKVLDRLRKGRMLGIRMQILNGRPMDVRMELRGFGNALKKLAQ